MSQAATQYNAREIHELRETLRNTNPVDVAERLESMDDHQAIMLFRMLPKDTAADVFAYLSRDMQENIVNAIQDYEIAHIIDELFLDDAVDFIEEMPAGVVKRVLSNLPKEKRNIINHFLKYPDGSVGSIMTIEYVDLKEFLTVAETFARIRRDGVDKETIYTLYVIDSQRKLLGAVSAKKLLLSSPDDKIGDIMQREITSATTADEAESVANDFRKYGLLAMPVVDAEGRLVGIVTVDDILEIQEEVATEDFELMAGLSPSDEPYLKTSIWTLVRNRLPWLIILMLIGIIAGVILDTFEDAISAIPVLVTFIPMLMNTGGAGGSQSSTLVIRGLALGEVALHDIFKVLWREMRIAFICGAALALVNFIRVLLMYNPDTLGLSVALLGLSVSLALWITVFMAKIVGCSLPLLAKRLKLDPAVMAAPVITTVVDASSLLVFFGIAKAMFGL
ncbi:MAG: magnesium transporter [Oscillospiraceae bacterium]|nr:magnesium transporter [Oscillospiraceae bacterium]